MQRRRSHRRRSTQEEKKTATSKLVQTSGRWLSASLAKHLNSIYISTHKSIDQGKISTMARGKVQLKRIENPVHRQVTFCKRRAGLLKKAKELSILCDSDIGVFIFSPQGKLYELATKGTMEGLMERYMKCTRGPQAESVAKKDQLLDSKEEVEAMKQEIKLLQKGLWSMSGHAEGTMTLDELHALEKHLESWIYHIRSTKMNILFQEIEILKNKEGALKAANMHLEQKIEEQNEFFNFAPAMTNIQYPLTTQNGIFNF